MEAQGSATLWGSLFLLACSPGSVEEQRGTVQTAAVYSITGGSARHIADVRPHPWVHVTLLLLSDSHAAAGVR